MKFICTNCKAKYQLPDEKVAGRTLRMNCRQCKAPIVIRGEASAPLPPSAGRVTAPAPLGSLRAPAPSPLGADFRARVAGGAPPFAAPPPLVVPSLADAWHVAIHDVPVGPMGREEVARKIALGAVGLDSLAWREGMDDWLPAKLIPDLAALFGSPAPDPHAAPPLPFQPARRATDMLPIGGRAGAAPPMMAPPWNVPPPDARLSQIPLDARLSQIPLAPARESEIPRAPGTANWGPMFAMAGGLAFLMTATAIVGVKYLGSDSHAPAPVVAPVTALAPTPAAAPAPSAPPAAKAPQGGEAGQGALEFTLDEVEIGAGDGSRQRRAAAAIAAATLPKSGAPGKQLTDAQKEMLARMGGGFDSDPSRLNAPSGSHGAGSNGPGGGALTAGQLSAVVLRGRENLQRCYETALRAAGGSKETVRMDVQVTISPSGNVTEADAVGSGLPGMEQCLERTVRMWRFPSAGESTQTKFPVVFQPGG